MSVVPLVEEFLENSVPPGRARDYGRLATTNQGGAALNEAVYGQKGQKRLPPLRGSLPGGHAPAEGAAGPKSKRLLAQSGVIVEY